MRVLRYSGLDISRVEVAYRRIAAALERDDFRAAEVKKLVGLKHGKFYRAKLDDSNRLLFALVRQGNEVCAVMLEVIENHAYARSRFLRGAAIDDDKIPVVATPPAVEEAEPVRYLHAKRREILYLDRRMHVTCTTPVVSSETVRMRCSSPTESSSSLCACRWDARPRGATLPPGSLACARRSAISMRIKPSKRCVG